MKYTKKKYIRKRTKRARGKSRVTKRHRRYKKKSFLLVGGNDPEDDPCKYEENDTFVKELANYVCKYSKMLDELKKAKDEFDCRNKSKDVCETELKKIISCPEFRTLTYCENVLASDYNAALEDFIKINKYKDDNNNNDDDDDVEKFANTLVLKKNIKDYLNESKIDLNDVKEVKVQKHLTLMNELNKDQVKNTEKIKNYTEIYNKIIDDLS